MTWQPGDTALCIKTCHIPDGPPALLSGTFCTVQTTVRYCGELGLTFSDHPVPEPHLGFLSSHFIKIDPEHFLEPEEEFQPGPMV